MLVASLNRAIAVSMVDASAEAMPSQRLEDDCPADDRPEDDRPAED